MGLSCHGTSSNRLIDTRGLTDAIRNRLIQIRALLLQTNDRINSKREAAHMVW